VNPSFSQLIEQQILHRCADAPLFRMTVSASFRVPHPASRALESLLFEVNAADPIIYGAVICVLLLVAMLASYLPARRAARVDPLTALRGD
jgi:ABC-type lipoprotein release transport system permease subunit